MRNFIFSEFCDLDKSPDADYLINSMDVMLSLESVQRIKRESVSLLNIGHGDIVLEAGCGFANDVTLIAELVGKTGQVIAIDSSKRMLDMAKNRINNKNIHYQLMNVEDLKYPDNYFSASHADRLLVSHANYSEIFQEILRVTKPGGTVVVTDVDPQTMVIVPSTPITEIVKNQILSSFINIDIGRKLIDIFNDFKLEEINVRANISTVESFMILNEIFDFKKILNSCIKNGDLTKKDSLEWVRSLRNFSKKNQFLYCIIFFTVSGMKSH